MSDLQFSATSARNASRFLKLATFGLVFSLIASVIAIQFQLKAFAYQEQIDTARIQIIDIRKVQTDLLDKLLGVKSSILVSNLSSDLNKVDKCKLVLGALTRIAPSISAYIQMGINYSYPAQIVKYRLEEMAVVYNSIVQKAKKNSLENLCSTDVFVDADEFSRLAIKDIQSLLSLSVELNEIVDSRLSNTKSQLLETYSDASRSIFFAFIIQLIIFMILNYLDVTIVRLERE